MTVDVRDLYDATHGRIPLCTRNHAVGNSCGPGYAPNPPLGHMVADALRTELRAAGHRIGAEGAAAVIDGRIDVASIWIDEMDRVFSREVRVSLDVSVTPTSRSRTGKGAYVARCNEVRDPFILPDSAIARLIGACVDNIARQFRDDPEIARVLGR